MNVSESAVTGLIEELNKIIGEINTMADAAGSFSSVARDWEDEVGNRLNMEMQRVANSVEAPVETLQKCVRKLEDLRQRIAEYERIGRSF